MRRMRPAALRPPLSASASSASSPSDRPSSTSSASCTSSSPSAASAPSALPAAAAPWRAGNAAAPLAPLAPLAAAAAASAPPPAAAAAASASGTARKTAFLTACQHKQEGVQMRRCTKQRACVSHTACAMQQSRVTADASAFRTFVWRRGSDIDSFAIAHRPVYEGLGFRAAASAGTSQCRPARPGG